MTLDGSGPAGALVAAGGAEIGAFGNGASRTGPDLSTGEGAANAAATRAARGR